MRLTLLLFVLSCAGKPGDDGAGNEGDSGGFTTIEAPGSGGGSTPGDSPADDTSTTEADDSGVEDPDVPEEVVMVSAELDVSEKVFLITSDTSQAHRFLFIAKYSDGSESIIVEDVEWTVNNAHIGAIDSNGLFVTGTTQGGKATIVGRYDGLWAMAEITVKFEGTYVPDGFDITVFDAPEVPQSGTGMIYPPDGVMLPKNQPAINFQWENLGATAYRLKFESEVTELTIYSTSLSWISDAELWPVIGRSNAGLVVTSTLSAAYGGEVVVKDPQSMTIQDLEATGSIIYWTPTASGLMEIPYAETARSFLTTAETGRCVGCHAVSRAGMVAVTYDGGSGPLGMKKIDDRSDVIAGGSGGNSNYKTFSADGSYLLSTLNGTLSLHDGITGAFLSNPSIAGTSWVTNVDWAPDDSYLVFIDSPGHSYDLTFTGGTIMRAPYMGDGVFGPAETILTLSELDPSYGFTTIYYPVVSPDSQWVMFNASTGDTYDDPDATIFVVPIDGGTPIEMAKANISPSTGSSLPKWAPATAGDDYWWFAFASRRPYGSVTSGIHQIWLSSFDPDLALAGEDPSSPAIWLSNQNPTQSNHIPLWVD